MVQTVIAPGFSSLKEPMTWSIHLNRRNSSAKRNDIIAGVAELVDKKHKACAAAAVLLSIQSALYIHTSEPV